MFALAWLPFVIWIGIALAVATALGLAIVAQVQRRDVLLLPAVGVVAAGLVIVPLGTVTPFGPGGTLTQLLVVALGIVAGSPVVRAVLTLADRRRDAEPASATEPEGATSADAAAVLRGGATIGYLERAAVVAAVLLARWEILAVLVAIKSVGRFRDLDAGHHVTERFIIGTLASLLWAGACAALIALA